MVIYPYIKWDSGLSKAEGWTENASEDVNPISGSTITIITDVKNALGHWFGVF